MKRYNEVIINSNSSSKIHETKKIKNNFIKGINNIKFDEMQKAFIIDTPKDTKIYGTSGSGKTFSMFYKIIKMYNDNIIQNNNEYLILTHNNIINSNLLSYSKNINNKYFTNNNIKTLYTLANIINKNLIGKKQSNSIYTSILSANNTLTISDIIDSCSIKILKNIKFLFIDNAQDLNKEEYDLIFKIKNIIKCKVFMFGDINQTINYINTYNFFINYDAAIYIFENNYRTKSNIINFYKNISSNNIYTQPHINCNDEDKVSIYNCMFDINFEQLLIKEIVSSKIDYHDIAIISPVKKPNANINCFDLNTITTILIKNNINVNINYNINSINSNENKFIIKKNAINIFTLNTCKGLEFKKVIILNFHLNTFGFHSSIEEYNNYKNLWYTGCSRAKDKLTIFINKNECIFPEFFNISKNTYDVILLDKTFEIVKKFDKLKKDNKIYSKSINNIIYNCKPKDKIKFDNMIKYKYDTKNLYDCDNISLLDYDKYKACYESFFKHIIQYFYEYKKISSSNFFTRTKEYINNIYIIDIVDIDRFLKIKEKFNIYISKKIYKSDICIYKTLCNDDENILLNNIELYMLNENKNYIYLLANNNVYNKYYKHIENICNEMISNLDNISYITYIFNITLFYHCLENDIEFIHINKFSNHINKSLPLIDKIKFYINNQEPKNLIFQKETIHPNINITGNIDIFDKDNEEIMIIICNDCFNIINSNYVYQLLLYYNNIFPKWDREKKLIIWNVLTGEKYYVYINPIVPFNFLCMLSDISGLKLNNISIGYDLETTGLDKNSCKIIDIACIEYNLGFEIINTLIDNDIKLPQEIIELTHITDEMIKENSMKYDDFFKKFKNIMSYFHKPKFIAHNGNLYDHYIMKRLQLFPKYYKYDYELYDSKNIINYLFKDRKSLKLTILYKDVFNVQELPYEAHKAKPDVLIMIDILKKLNFKFY